MILSGRVWNCNDKLVCISITTDVGFRMLLPYVSTLAQNGQNNVKQCSCPFLCEEVVNCELNNAKLVQFMCFWWHILQSTTIGTTECPDMSKHLYFLLKLDQDRQNSIQINIYSIIQLSPYIVYYANDRSVCPQIQSTLGLCPDSGF